ncbi:MAG: 2-C-methyl-D-erythritol 2,4-cyclodiphosphate synthase [Clostridia bacterium]|nr:2-C-methyl-D-erythritol 2,4-cyclodiphosphate synthase [Clostridia bacterium]
MNKGKFRVGHGYDVHRLVFGRKLIIGGVDIPHETGLDGHSDADVLCHAIADALLGAIGEKDIGYHFPDTDKKYEGISSLILLKEVKKLLDDKMAGISNIDATVIAQRPKLMPFIDQMKKNIAEALSLDCEDVNIKATTEEKLGFTGRCEGISAHAVCLIYY